MQIPSYREHYHGKRRDREIDGRTILKNCTVLSLKEILVRRKTQKNGKKRFNDYVWFPKGLIGEGECLKLQWVCKLYIIWFIEGVK